MKTRYRILAVFALAAFAVLVPRIAQADKLTFSDGASVDGVVKKIEKGQVTVEVGTETKVFDVLAITDIEFDTPHLTLGTPRLPLEHFIGGLESNEMMSHFTAVEKSAADVRKLIDQTRRDWAGRTAAKPNDTINWTNSKQRFVAPLSLYQEHLNDLYFHVLGKVDEYNSLMKDADTIYVGVRGWFQAGSSLIPHEMKSLPLKKYVPGNWYDSIFFDGYDRGYSEAYEKYSKDPAYAR
jgi:hypothetical protein